MDTSSRDEQLWRLARKRANFKISLMFYVAINLFMWAIWFFTAANKENMSGVPWPVWIMAGWGIGIIMQYVDAYHNKTHIADSEYKKLKEGENR